MSEQPVFWSLVKHDMKRRRNIKKNRNRMSRKWVFVYVCFALLIILGFTSYGAVSGHIRYDGTWYFTCGLPFMIFGMVIHRINVEWQNETVGWWLSLPYSRGTLIRAKFVASLITSIKTCLIIYLLIILFGLYTMALNGQFAGPVMWSFIREGLTWGIFMIASSPIIVSFGVFTGTLSHTNLKPALPMVWVLIWVIGILTGMTGTNFSYFYNKIGLPLKEIILGAILISWLVAYILIKASAYLLDQKLAL
ncbi:ABC transporter permease [Pullulanibacillus sp. KACC 23026]|uniref:ABC transporter permease n=1 Tax=Pullulanibacillus sp. KACC 23026 TaxID=3028315 RepID=UPI0023B144CE|nr:ABC transporter permease [Pullulanibacillus sp. KACC 23026]WEG10906.1 ABC transporter permease [Pullulanibacillus sp. KACC 23026]